MIQTINPYATARTAEIMSRYRPIAPKPESPAANSSADADTTNSSAVPNGIRKSPYLRNVWAHLQARPTRTRKRGRSAAFSPPSVKRPRPCLQGLSPPYQLPSPSSSSAASPAAMHAAFSRLPQISIAPNLVSDSVALPLLYCTAAAAAVQPPPKDKGIDLNLTAAADQQPPEELDLLLQLQLQQEPAKPSVISPRPVRPVGSSVIVKRIADDPRPQTMAEDVEEVVEAEAVPAIVSDSNNRVRMCNSAYKEMVGQPECCWLDCAAGKRCRGGGGGERIGGEISLRFVDSKGPMAAAFTCSVKIEWEGKEGKKKCVNAACSAVKLVSQTKDYQFLWRFNTDEAKSAAASSDD